MLPVFLVTQVIQTAMVMVMAGQVEVRVGLAEQVLEMAMVPVEVLETIRHLDHNIQEPNFGEMRNHS